MVLIRRRKTKDFLVRPRCKECHNGREKGYRRAYKTKYLRRWRRENAAINRSYWHDRDRAVTNASSYKHFKKNHAAILIQGRLRRAGFPVTLPEARKLLRRYGRCYPTNFGLTAKGRRECERIRSRCRSAVRAGKQRRVPRGIEIRMMVYADGTDRPDSTEGHGIPDAFVITRRLQPVPFRVAAKRLTEWHQGQRGLNASVKLAA